MYILIILLLLALGAFLVRQGYSRHTNVLTSLGVGVLILTPLSLLFMSFWGEWLWFQAIGYRMRFWFAVLAATGISLVAGLIAALVVWMFTSRPQGKSRRRNWPPVTAAIFGILWGTQHWIPVLKWWYHVQTGEVDPIHGIDLSYYLFTLPLLDGVYWYLLVVIGLSLLALVTQADFLQAINKQIEAARSAQQFSNQGKQRSDAGNPLQNVTQSLKENFGTVCVLFGVGLLVLAFGTFLQTRHLLYSQLGAVIGAGWTEVNVRLPVLYVMTAASALVGLYFLFSGLRSRLGSTSMNASQFRTALTRRIGWPVGGLVALSIIGQIALPVLAQWLYVSPNEISVEKPYLKNNIQLTREAFGLDDIEVRQFSVSEELTESTIENNRNLIDNIRLWDPRALLATYEQFQEIRLYYEFLDVDIDRYQLGDRYRQVMVSPREIDVNNLPPKSQTFVNRRFKYTHGYGVTLAPVSDFTSEGLPDLLVKDLPPKTRHEELEIDKPQIYYGQNTNEHVVVNTKEPEFDYPSGDENVYNRYEGTGGVRLSSAWRQFLYGWKFDGTRLFLTSYPTEESRIQFHRNITERVKTLAPFLKFDKDPYIVVEKGRLYWIIDAYTTSSHYPYSEPLTLDYVSERRPAANYVRNSVKAVVDAHSGSVDFYIFEPEDPIIQVWDRIFPDLFKPRNEMSEELQQHIRYPEGLLSAQGTVYQKYHMTDPEVFYNQEDLWVRATEKYYAQKQPVTPYYVMWEPPESDRAEFILMQPFTPKNRQVMIGWIAGMCDGENYGRLLAYRFPKEKRILGPQQVETKIDQDRFLSEQLTLWDQRGSRVIRGNLLVIPVNDTLLYVEPIYLQAEVAAYPELRLVTVMHNDQLSYARNFEEALEGLFGEGKQQPSKAELADPLASQQALIQQANSAFREYLRLTSQNKFIEAGEKLQQLEKTLNRLANETKQPGQQPESDSQRPSQKEGKQK